VPDQVKNPLLDERAFATFLEQVRPRVLAFARRLCDSPVDADDVMQETMERTWRYRDAWDPSANPEAWVMRAAFHVFVDQRRRRQRDPVPATSALERAADTPACLAELRDEIEVALRGLEQLERAILLGFHRDGLSLRELAARHAMPLNTVKTHLHRARRKLPGGEAH